jgi:hypothetical protein
MPDVLIRKDDIIMSKFASLASEGFDVAAALQQLAGSEKLYLSVITKFATLYKDLDRKSVV